MLRAQIWYSITDAALHKSPCEMIPLTKMGADQRVCVFVWVQNDKQGKQPLPKAKISWAISTTCAATASEAALGWKGP